MTQRIGPYRVEERLGAGGMGEVYKAYDDRLERWVAIKRIRGDKDEGVESRQRFQREARATAKLNHSSIVHLYDIFQDGDSDCIVMEYVEGKTLDRLIRNGPLEPQQAASLGHEIASGLAEAHSKGIIHRDLKVENVIVTPQGHAKILDFGLARPLLKDDLDASLTGKGQLVGTSRTMSPEYVSGEDIDHRSDLFSLGVLLYEAVTSHSPFRAHNTLATLKQVMLHRQTPAHHVNANVPEELSVVIEGLLEKDPVDRPQSAREVAEEFGRISGQLSSGGFDRPTSSATFTSTPTEIFTTTATSVDIWARRRWLTMVVVVLVVGIIATYFLTRWWLSESSKAPDRRVAAGKAFNRIVLADFENHTGEPLLDDSMELVFRLGLEQSGSASVLPRSQIQNALLRMQREPDTPVTRQLGIEISLREGAQALVVGAIGKIGKTYSLSAEIVEPQTGDNVFATKEVTDDQSQLVAVLEKISKAIRLNLGEPSATVEETQKPLEKVTTKNLAALKAYSLGLAKITEDNKTPESRLDAHEEGMRLLQRAIELDPEFAMAHAKLGAASINLGLSREKTLEHLDKALLLSDRLTEIEKLYVEGWAARLHGNPGAVIRTWSLMSTLYPNEYIGHQNLGLAYWSYFEQFEDAAQAFESAVEVAPPEKLAENLIWLGYSLLALERYEEALATFKGASGSEKLFALADLYLAENKHADVRSLMRDTETIPSRLRSAPKVLRLAHLYAARGSLEQARTEIQEVRLGTENKNLKHRLANQLTMAGLLQYLPEEGLFRDTLAEAMAAAKETMDTEQKIDSAPVSLLALIGKFNARNGLVFQAESIHDWIESVTEEMPLVVWQGYSAVLEGEILAAQGRIPAAVSLFEKAIGLVGSFQAHESLARAYAALGRLEDAIDEYEWLVKHPGRGIVECLDECQVLSTVDWTVAFYRLGRLHEENENRDRALHNYERFLNQWKSADDLPVWRDALARSSALRETRIAPQPAS